MPNAFSDSLLTPARSAAYQIQTDTSTTVREKTARNSITLTLRQTYYSPADNGIDAVLIELLRLSGQ